MSAWTIGHGRCPIEELLACLEGAAVETLVGVRRSPGSRRNQQFGQDAPARPLGAAGIGYRHAVELGGRLDGEPGAERFRCLVARGHEVVHLVRPHETAPQRLGRLAEARSGHLYLGGELVA